ncbi:MAG: DNA (cytosine-5-)-methyltransferase [Clostridia bacterium]|nr:DNA (cytosine-5-)-methyltransferase [Clostridia bacterium]
MFAGIGGIDIAFIDAGFDVVWANEMDSAACRTYRHNFDGSVLEEKDIKKINKLNIPVFDVLVAGFPCQPFSVAGKQQGFKHKSGDLFFQIIEVVKIVKPKVIFLENVANLIDHNEGKTFNTMFSSLAGMNYYIRYKNMSANEYGNIPQTRNRTYIVAFNNESACEHFNFPEPMKLTLGIFDVIDRFEKKKPIYYYNEDDNFYPNIKKQVTRSDSIYRVYNSQIHIAKSHTCPTLHAFMGTDLRTVPIVKDKYGYRRLTIQEYLDFQGFPKNYSFPAGTRINEAYKQIGNSVCVPVIKRIADQIKKIMIGENNELR